MERNHLKSFGAAGHVCPCGEGTQTAGQAALHQRHSDEQQAGQKNAFRRNSLNERTAATATVEDLRKHKSSSFRLPSTSWKAQYVSYTEKPWRKNLIRVDQDTEYWQTAREHFRSCSASSRTFGKRSPVCQAGQIAEATSDLFRAAAYNDRSRSKSNRAKSEQPHLAKTSSSPMETISRKKCLELCSTACWHLVYHGRIPYVRSALG